MRVLTRIIWLPIWLMTVSGCALAAQAQAPQPCRSATGSEPLVGWLTSVATGTDSQSVAKRARYHIPSTTAANVTVVSDSATCQQAVAAYTASLADASTTRRLYLVRVDTTFAALDPETTRGEWKIVMIMSSAFGILSRLTY